jgi:hypothetical protein
MLSWRQTVLNGQIPAGQADEWYVKDTRGFALAYAYEVHTAIMLKSLSRVIDGCLRRLGPLEFDHYGIRRDVSTPKEPSGLWSLISGGRYDCGLTEDKFYLGK